MNFSDTPKVSVLMSAYNAEAHLPNALRDTLSQTIRDIEVIVVEDGSQDDTYAILERYASSDDRLTILKNEQNLGLPKSLNRGLARCRAPVIARADADDEYLPDRLEKQLAFLDENPDIGLLSCAVQKIDTEGSELFVNRFPTTDAKIRLRELFVNCISHPGAMFRKHLVDEVGGYNPKFFMSEDADLWLRLRRITKVANLDSPLVRYRKHPQSAMQKISYEGEALSLSVRQRAIAEYLDRPVSLYEAAAMVDLFRARPDRSLSRTSFFEGRRGLREVLRRARSREPASAISYFKDEVFKALVQQARREKADRMLSAALLAEAANWNWARAAGKARRKLWPGAGSQAVSS